MGYVKFTSLFLCCVQQQHPKYTKRTADIVYAAALKDKGCKNLAHTSKTRQVKHFKWLRLLGTRFDF